MTIYVMIENQLEMAASAVLDNINIHSHLKWKTNDKRK